MKWIKIICVFLLGYVTIAGFLFDVPALPILNEAIRVLFFHVPMWFTMIFLLFISAINSYYYISKGRTNYDIKSNELNLLSSLSLMEFLQKAHKCIPYSNNIQN